MTIMISILKEIDLRYMTQDPKRLLTFAYDSKKSKLNSVHANRLALLNKTKIVRKLRRLK